MTKNRAKVFGGTLLAMSMFAASLGAHAEDVKVTLSGAEEVPPVSTEAKGEGTITIGEDKSVSGTVTTTGVEACAFVDPEESGEEGTVQLYCVPTVYLDRDISGIEPCQGVTLTPGVMRPKARGSVKLRSANPADPPVVDCNFFGHPDDLKLQVAGLRFARRIMATSPMKELLDGELFPGSDKSSDADLEALC